MNRRSIIKCILGLAASPKVLSELDFRPPLMAETVQSDWILARINAASSVVEYDSVSFVLTDLDEIIQSYYSTKNKQNA